MYLIIDINEAPHRPRGKSEEWVIIAKKVQCIMGVLSEHGCVTSILI